MEDFMKNDDLYFGIPWNNGVGDNDEFIDLPQMIEHDLEMMGTLNSSEFFDTNKILEANGIDSLMSQALSEITHSPNEFLQLDAPLVNVQPASPQNNCQLALNPMVDPSSPMVQSVSPNLLQPSSPMVQPVSPNLVQPSSPMVQPVSPNLVQPSSPMVQPVSPNLVQPSSPMVQPVSPNLVQPSSPMVQPVSPNLVQPSSPMVRPVSPYLVQPSSVPVVQPSSPNPMIQPTSLIMKQPALSFTTLQPAAPHDLMEEPALSFTTLQPAKLELQIPEATVTGVEYMPTPSSSKEDIVQMSIGSTYGDIVVSLEQPCVVSSAQASAAAENAPKKRGRKSKNLNGVPSRRRGARKPKVYELDVIEDEDLEKKRRNAINAKRHRDLQKEQKAKLELDLTMITTERDHLLEEVKVLREREKKLQEKINSMSLVNYLVKQ